MPLYIPLKRLHILKQNFKSLPQQLEHAKENKNNHTHTPKNELVNKQVTFIPAVLYTFKSNGKNI